MDGKLLPIASINYEGVLICSGDLYKTDETTTAYLQLIGFSICDNTVYVSYRRNGVDVIFERIDCFFNKVVNGKYTVIK